MGLSQKLLLGLPSRVVKAAWCDAFIGDNSITEVVTGHGRTLGVLLIDERLHISSTFTLGFDTVSADLGRS